MGSAWIPREVEQPFFAHPICTTTASYMVSQPLLDKQAPLCTSTVAAPEDGQSETWSDQQHRRNRGAFLRKSFGMLGKLSCPSVEFVGGTSRRCLTVITQSVVRETNCFFFFRPPFPVSRFLTSSFLIFCSCLQATLQKRNRDSSNSTSIPGETALIKLKCIMPRFLLQEMPEMPDTNWSSHTWG